MKGIKPFVEVKEGDTLSHISLRHFGTTKFWPWLARLNNLRNPDLIWPKQRIFLA